MMSVNRREFVKDGLSALGFLALPGTPLFAAPLGWKPKDKKPNLVLGILSDTHLMVEWDGVSLYRSMTLDYIRNAFRLFKARGIDAFLHLGDASHRGGVREWEFHTEVFDSVFGRRIAPPKIFVVGNHELYGDDGHHIRKEAYDSRQASKFARNQGKSNRNNMESLKMNMKMWKCGNMEMTRTPLQNPH